MINFTNKHLIIVGGSRGIGAAAATMIAEAGGVVSVIYNTNKEQADKVVGRIVENGGKAACFQGHVEEEASIGNAIEDAVKLNGIPHGLVVSAGIFEGADLNDMTPLLWDRVLSINLKGTFLAVKETVKHMRKGKQGGSIVIYTSTAGQCGSDFYSAYAASKGGQIVFMKSMAIELASDKIRVNCIAPAWTETDMARKSLDELGRENESKKVPLGRIGLPEDVAKCTCFLLSELAGFVTGITLTCDGGVDMRG